MPFWNRTYSERERTEFLQKTDRQDKNYAKENICQAKIANAAGLNASRLLGEKLIRPSACCFFLQAVTGLEREELTQGWLI